MEIKEEILLVILLCFLLSLFYQFPAFSVYKELVSIGQPTLIGSVINKIKEILLINIQFSGF